MITITKDKYGDYIIDLNLHYPSWGWGFLAGGLTAFLVFA